MDLLSPLCVCRDSHYRGLSGPFPYVLPDSGLVQTIMSIRK